MCIPALDVVTVVAVAQGVVEITDAEGHSRRATFEDLPKRLQAVAKCMTMHCQACGAPHALDEKRCSYCLTPC